MSEHAPSFYVVGEDEVHRALAMAITDAAIEQLCVEHDADWLELDWARRWRAVDERDDVPRHRRWGSLHDDRPPVHGMIRGRPVQPGARKLREAIVEITRRDDHARLLVLLQDTDGKQKLHAGVQQVADWADTDPDVPPVAIGAPHRDAEAWFFAIAERSAQEDLRLAEATRALTFDPARQPERLTSQPNHATTDAKRVVRYVFLADGDTLAEGRPASRPPDPDRADVLARRLASRLDRLTDYEACGLTTFITAVKESARRALHERLPARRS